MRISDMNWGGGWRLTGWAAAYLLLAAMLLGANPMRGETVGPFDLLASVSGWNPDAVPVEVRHRERSDIVDALVPAWLEARGQLRDGTLPLWNPLPAGGTPALFDPTTVELTPGFLLFAMAPDPAFGFYLSVLCCMVLAGLGMHQLVARHHAWPVALFGGCSYMLCGFITAWLFWPHTHTAIWIPWLLLAVDSLVSRDSPRAYAGVAATTALMVFGGFPFVVAIGLGAALVHGTVLAVARGRGFVVAKTTSVLLAIILGLLLAAVPLLTLATSLADTDLSHRRGGSGLSLTDVRLLLGPWLSGAHRVESNMYVGVVALVFAATGLGALSRRTKNPLGWTGLVCALVGAALVFGILPESIGTRLPVLSNNPWHRAILLLDIGLVLLAATGLGWLTEGARWRRTAVAAVLAACALQVADLGTHFRRFNGPTPSRYFYAESPAIRYVKDRIRPFQHVAVDNAAFLISGTTGGAGLADWYAHALRSSALHGFLDEMAEEPLTTATATAIGVRRYEWEDDLLDVAALCYALYPNSVEVLPIALAAKNGARREALAPINHVSVVQRIRLDEPVETSVLAVRLATYRATDLDGEARLTLSKVDGSEPSIIAVVPGSQIRDNQMAMFRFGRALWLPAGDYRIELSYVPGPASRNVTAWIFRDVPGEVLRDGVSVPGSLDYALYGMPKGALVPVFHDRAVTVAVNDGCASGPYWVRDLDDPKGTMSRSAARLSLYAPADFSVRVEGTLKEGYVVVPMRLRGGWEATLDGNRVTLLTIHGILPAVKVPAGTSTVAFRYRPPHWPLGLAATLLSALALIWLWRASTRKPPEAPHF